MKSSNQPVRRRVLTLKNKHMTPKQLVGIGGAFLVGLLVGVYALQFAQDKNLVPFIAQPKERVEREYPFDQALLENPLLVTWGANVEGILTQVNEDTIVVEGPDAKLVLAIQEGYTSFYPETISEEGEATLGSQVPLSEVETGTRVRGFASFGEGLEIGNADGLAGGFILLGGAQ